ncbi:MAG: phosphatidylserine decarboxylase family protein [Thermoflexibacter sp.]|jgi:phosphatidylserine decarboxylase|nr:phosphatidylserine decarboxylase family protein [Thermoflexibacter sp.]
MTIHREGYPTLALVTVSLGVINFAIWQFFPENNIIQNIVLIVSLILFFIVLQFFRHPLVKVPINPNHILAPCDGKVVVIEETIEDEYFKSPRRQVSIFMSPINVHVNRNPISGVVRFVKYHAGKYLVAWHPKSSTENERTSIVIQNDKGVEILMRQIAGALARRICWYVKESQIVTQGEEFGFIKFGSRVDLFLPLDAKISVKIGDKTKAGVTVIAEA